MVASMRIAHVTATFPPYRGGTGNVCYHNARELARRGHDVHVFTAAAAGAPEEETHEGIHIHRLQPLIRVGNAPVLPQLLWSLKHFDIIHLHYPFFGGEITTLAAKLNRTPLILTYHQDVHLDGFMGTVAQVLNGTVGRWTLRGAERVLFTSTDYGQASAARYTLAGQEHVVGELPNGVDIKAFTPAEAPAAQRERYSLAERDQVALLVAALDNAHYFKGVGVFLEAIAHLSENVKAVIVGDGGLRHAYETQAKDLGVADRVCFAGRVSDEALVAHYQLADVTVLPSTTMGEAFGLVLVESLACGTPVIASNLPGVRTVVDDGIDGYLVEPGNAEALAEMLRMLLSMPTAQRTAMGQAGRRKVEERYAWEQIGAHLEAIYRQARISVSAAGMNRPKELA